MSSYSENFEEPTCNNEKSSEKRFLPRIALITGAVTKVSPLLVGWAMSVTFPAHFDIYAFVYFIVRAAIAVFLAGLTVGFRVRYRDAKGASSSEDEQKCSPAGHFLHIASCLARSSVLDNSRQLDSLRLVFTLSIWGWI